MRVFGSAEEFWDDKRRWKRGGEGGGVDSFGGAGGAGGVGGVGGGAGVVVEAGSRGGDGEGVAELEGD